MGFKPRAKLPTCLGAAIVRYQDARACANELWSIYEGQPAQRGASEDGIARLRAKFGTALPADYEVFLRVHDGWDGYEYDRILMPVQEVLDDRAVESVEINIDNIDEDEADKLSDVFVIGCDNDSATILYIDRTDGSIVEYYCEEQGRWPSLTAYFEGLASNLEVAIAGELEKQKDACTDWDPNVRKQKDEAYRAELKSRLDAANITARPLTAEDEAAIQASLRGIAKVPVRAIDLRESKLQTYLTFTGYMLYVPTVEEVTKAALLFRKHFPWNKRTLACAPSDEYNKKPIPSDATDYSDFLKIQTGGHFGLRMVDDNGGKKTTQIFNFRGAPEWRDEPIASFLEILLPVDADHEALRSFTLDVADEIPVASAYAGFAALPLNSDFAKHMEILHGWCRAHWGLQIAYVDELLSPVLHGIHGVSWLTLIDREVARHVNMPTEHDIRVYERELSTVIQAGDAPSLGDVREEYPSAFAVVHNAIAPLVTPNISDLRHFNNQGATQAWWRRFEDPTAFAINPADLLDGIRSAAEAGNPDKLRSLWAKLADREPAARESIRDDLSKLAHSLVNMNNDVAIVLYDWLTTMESPRLHDLNNSLVAAWKQPDIADVFVERALPFGERNPSIFHNVIGLYVERGDINRAISTARQAEPHYTIKLFQLLESDKDFAPLFERAEYLKIHREMKQRLEPTSTWEPLARNDELERRIGAHPNDAAVYREYAAWLDAEDDARGPLIEAQIAESENPRSKPIRAESRKLLAEYIRNRIQVRFPKLGEQFDKDVFHWGLVHTFYMHSWPQDLHAEGLAFLRDPESLFLRRLHLKGMEIDLNHIATSTPYLTQLNLSGATFKSIEPIARLAQLDELVLTSTAVTNLTPLGAMPRLRKLYLKSTNVIDLSPIKSLPRLEFVSLEGASTTNIEPLLELPRLCELWLYNTAVPKVQAEKVEALIKSRNIQPGPGVTTMVYGP